MKTPNQAPKLPIKRIIADSYATTQPDESLMEKGLLEIKKLEQEGTITTEDYYFMRYSDDVKRSIMEFTKGDPEVFTQGTVPQIMERARNKIREDAEKRVKEEKLKREETDSRYFVLIEESRHDTEKRLDNLHLKFRSIARWMISVVRAASIIVLIILAAISLPYNTLLP